MEIDEQEIMQELEAGPSVKKARVDTSVDTSAQACCANGDNQIKNLLCSCLISACWHLRWFILFIDWNICAG